MPGGAKTRSVTVAERRARIGFRHHLATEARAWNPVDVARGVVCLHATDPASVFLAVAARAEAVDASAIERALYDDRSLVRMLGMRRTLFVFPTETAPLAQAACTRAIAERLRRRLVQFLEPTGVARDVGRWLRQVENSTIAALKARGEATAVELSRDEPRLTQKIVVAEGKSYGGPGNITTQLLSVLAAQGRIVRGRPTGAAWTSTTYRYAPIAAWLEGGLPEVDVADAQAALVRLYLDRFGPAPESDVRWWTGLAAREVRPALAAIGAVEVDIEGVPALVLPDDLEPTAAPKPWAALLPALDPTVMGWQKRDWFLGEHGPALFDSYGNAGPSVWWGGRIVGGWTRRKDGSIPYRLLEDVGTEAKAAIEREAERLREWIGPVTVLPRFRTPLQLELSA